MEYVDQDILILVWQRQRAIQSTLCISNILASAFPSARRRLIYYILEVNTRSVKVMSKSFPLQMTMCSPEKPILLKAHVFR